MSIVVVIGLIVLNTTKRLGGQRCPITHLPVRNILHPELEVLRLKKYTPPFTRSRDEKSLSANKRFRHEFERETRSLSIEIEGSDKRHVYRNFQILFHYTSVFWTSRKVSRNIRDFITPSKSIKLLRFHLNKKKII